MQALTISDSDVEELERTWNTVTLQDKVTAKTEPRPFVKLPFESGIAIREFISDLTGIDCSNVKLTDYPVHNDACVSYHFVAMLIEYGHAAGSVISEQCILLRFSKTKWMPIFLLLKPPRFMTTVLNHKTELNRPIFPLGDFLIIEFFAEPLAETTILLRKQNDLLYSWSIYDASDISQSNRMFMFSWHERIQTFDDGFSLEHKGPTNRAHTLPPWYVDVLPRQHCAITTLCAFH